MNEITTEYRVERDNDERIFCYLRTSLLYTIEYNGKRVDGVT